MWVGVEVLRTKQLYGVRGLVCLCVCSGGRGGRGGWILTERGQGVLLQHVDKLTC